ncbi:amidohydrolase [Catellatospora methionotrophica]|uniref:Amidohydrolase n=1 Tax=Catellatospora methionotrophica TaxID=121620 RepID=A0A8J3PKN1_9ACTN|nr:M20 family metallopeptidase [Catellatospora methionotrophica]GIG18641.1 amidohydrolase [Catellatospora methionotrophica]
MSTLASPAATGTTADPAHDGPATPDSGFRDAVTEHADDLIALRRAVHRRPEIGLHLPQTQDAVLRALDGLPLEITTGRSLSSVVAVLRGGLPGPVVLLRGDMDALPVTELTGLEYASEVDGVMHACGHDLHVAMLVGAARLLSGVRDRLPGSVIFMFQPGEEGPGGAEPMIAEGLLAAAGEHPAAAYCIHVLSAIEPFGRFSTRRGPMLAAADTLRVTVHGAGGHGSAPQFAKDPIPAACEMVTALQTFVTRRIDIFDPAVITVGSFHAGTAENVIPAQAVFAATLRSFSPETRDRVRQGVLDVVHGIAAAHGLTADAVYTPGYPVTVNDGGEAEFAAATAAELFGADRFAWMANPEAGAEDMSYVLEQVPGAFVNLGACPPGLDPMTAPLNHAAQARYDDAVVPDGAVLLAELAWRRMSR